jgi:peptidyl-prolyl cis-trans isomerase A (cyclophilin A)
MRAMIRRPKALTTLTCLMLAGLFSTAACKDKETPTTEAEPQPSASTKAKPAASTRKKPTKPDPKELAERRQAMKDRLSQRKLAAKPVAKVKVSEGDPEQGEFTVEEATKGLGNEGALIAEITTDSGVLSCELYEDRAPITVANFVGLARGLRPFEKDKKWIKKPFYDGTTFHRVIKGFMIQGGDPLGNGTGGPGFVIPDEIWENAKHDKRGLLCMANSGANTNGSQFFIMDGAASHLDGGYTIFGQCSPETVIEKLAATEVQGDRAVKAPKIKKVAVRRDKSKPRLTAQGSNPIAPGPSGSASLPIAPPVSASARTLPKPPTPIPAPKPSL